MVELSDTSFLVLGGYVETDVDAAGNVRFPPTLRLGSSGWEELPPAPVGHVEAAVTYEDGVAVTGTDTRVPADPAAVRAARFTPSSGTWTALPTPMDDVTADALWNLDGAVLLAPDWGIGTPGTPLPRQLLDLAAEPSGQPAEWTDLPLIGLFDGALDGVQGSATVWTGAELLVWGGGADGGYGADPVAVGARYRPAD